MTVVNKFNVNKQQVTLDADIIENMSANDVSYNSSLQYDKNTVGDKLSKLESEIDVFKETVTDQVNNYKPIVINGDVTNAPDEEDLTSVDGLLKFKNRSTLNGMGYVILRKDKSFSEQITQANTIYEIRYDFDLGGTEVNIKNNCVLKFNGGSISNGTIDLNYCKLEKNITFKNCYINNLSGVINATNLGLEQDDDISLIIGSGWKNVKIDLQNLNLIQHNDIFFNGGNFTYIIRWNVNGINSLISNNNSRDGEDGAKLQFNDIKDARIENCTFDGTGSNVDYITNNFYFDFMGVGLYSCPNAIVKNNIIKNFPATTGIFAEHSHNIHIEDNYIKNCSIYIEPVDDTAGDGIYLRNTNNSIIKNNVVEIEDTIQIGRCGICQEYHTSGIIENNTVSGYDRGIHIEKCYDYNIVKNNRVTRCHSAIMIWYNSDYANTGNIAHITVENNYLSNKGMVKSSINNKNYTPLTYERSIVDLRNAAGSSFNENKNTEFINNTIESFDTSDYNNYFVIQTDYSGKIIKNKFIRKGTHIPTLKLIHFHQNYDNHFYFVENEFEGYFYVANCPYITINNNIIKQLQVSFFNIKPFDITHDYTTQISIQNNIYQMLAESRYEAGAVAIFSSFGGIFKNNVWGLGTSHYSLFDEKNIAKGTVIDNNVFQITHSYEQSSKNIWYGKNASEVSPNLTPGKNLLVNLINDSNTTIIDNPQYSV